METPKELKARLLEFEDGRELDFEVMLILARIAESLDRIEKEGIFTYPRPMEEANYDEEEE